MDSITNSTHNKEGAQLPGVTNPISYIVDDFLDLSCQLDIKKRNFLISRLDLNSDCMLEIRPYQTFRLQKKLICILGTSGLDECWHYYPNQLRIEKHIVRGM